MLTENFQVSSDKFANWAIRKLKKSKSFGSAEPGSGHKCIFFRFMETCYFTENFSKRHNMLTPELSTRSNIPGTWKEIIAFLKHRQYQILRKIKNHHQPNITLIYQFYFSIQLLESKTFQIRDFLTMSKLILRLTD